MRCPKPKPSNFCPFFARFRPWGKMIGWFRFAPSHLPKAKHVKLLIVQWQQVNGSNFKMGQIFFSSVPQASWARSTFVWLFVWWCGLFVFDRVQSISSKSRWKIPVVDGNGLSMSQESKNSFRGDRWVVIGLKHYGAGRLTVLGLPPHQHTLWVVSPNYKKPREMLSLNY